MLSRCSRSLAAVAAKASATAATATAAATAAAAASVSASRSFATLRARTAVASAKNRSSSPLATASLPVSLALCRSSLRLISSGRKSSRNVTSVPAAHSHSSAAAAATANVTPLPPPTPPTAAASAAAGTDAEVPWYLSGPELDLNFVEYDTPRTGGPLKAPVLFLHGLLGNQANFRAFTAKHPSLVDRRVLCVDARNHGLSPRSDDLRYVSLARDISRLIATQLRGSPPPLIVGHSLGGKVAMATALLGKVPLHSILVLDIAPVTYALDGSAITSSKAILQAMDEVDLSPAAAPTRQAVNLQLQPLIKDDAVRQFVLTNLVPNVAPRPLVAPAKGSVLALASSGRVVASPSRERDAALKARSRADPYNKPPGAAFTHTRRRAADERRPRMTVAHPETGEMRTIVGERGREKELAQLDVDWSKPASFYDKSLLAKQSSNGGALVEEDSEFEDDVDFATPAFLPLEADIDAVPLPLPAPGTMGEAGDCKGCSTDAPLFRWRASVKRLLKGYDAIRHFDVASFAHNNGDGSSNGGTTDTADASNTSPQSVVCSVPATFVRSQNSLYVTAAHVAGPIAALFPHARVITYPCRSHWVHAECPAVLRAHVAAVLDPPAAPEWLRVMEGLGAVVGVKDV